MVSPPLATLWSRVTALPALYLGLWAALALLTVVLLVLMRTSWGRDRPTHRYVLLSLIAHLALICLATTVRFMSAPYGEQSAAPIKVRIVMRSQIPVEEPVDETPVTPEPAIVPEQAVPEPDLPNDSDPAEEVPLDQPNTLSSAPLMEAPPLLPSPPPTPAETGPEATAIVEPSAETPLAETPQSTTPIRNEPSPTEVAPAQLPQPSSQPPTYVATTTLPTAYSARTEDERTKLVEEEGGSRATEEAVAAGLAWLASAQARDGRWDASHWSAGQETQTLGHNRRGAGAKADTGITGLALLALLGAGNTHEQGHYAANLRAGLGYLMRSQASDGGLAGDAAIYAQTYCHSMATFALAEASATTDDRRLENAVRRAVDFLVARQDRAGGGWRYAAGAEGDMSQMGWIIMALRSAELGGIDVPPTCWSSIERFVRSTRRGRAGGMACYQPHGPVSRTMTAESLYCRQILGWPMAGTQAADEAVLHLVGAVPGQGRPNLYYWYYAALALHHQRDAGMRSKQAWRTWNDAMTRTLTASQIQQGPNTGSWSPNTLWGGYGGRVYSTALATMCLEVYYRYDAQQVARDPWIAARPSAGRLR